MLYIGNNPLITAAWIGNITVLKKLLRHEESFCPDRLGTPLHAASARGHLDIVRYLIAKKHIRERDINGLHSFYDTPVCAASCHGRFEVVKFLILHGAEVNLGRAVQTTALSSAVLNVHKETIQLLLENGAFFYPALLLLDSINIDKKALSLIEDYANKSEEAKWRYNALCIKCYFGDYTGVKSLLENEKAMSKLEQLDDADYEDLGSEGPLVMAIRFGYKRVLDLLLEAATPPILQGNIVLAALQSGNNDIIQSVLAHPEKCHLACQECENGVPALQYAIERGNYETAYKVYQSIYEQSEKSEKSLAIINTQIDVKHLAQKLQDLEDTYTRAKNEYIGCMEFNQKLGLQVGGAELLSLRKDGLSQDASTELEITTGDKALKDRAPEEVQEAIGLFFSALSFIVKYIVDRV